MMFEASENIAERIELKEITAATEKLLAKQQCDAFRVLVGLLWIYFDARREYSYTIITKSFARPTLFMYQAVEDQL